MWQNFEIDKLTQDFLICVDWKIDHWKVAKVDYFGVVRTRGPYGKLLRTAATLLANQIQGFGIPDQWEAGE